MIAMVLYVTAIQRFNPGLPDLLLYPATLLLLMLVSFPVWRRQARRLQSELDSLDRFQSD